MITYNDIEEYNLLDNDTIKMIPKKCMCGSDINVTESLREIVCSNKYCHYTIGKRIYKMLTDLGIISWDMEECISIAKDYNFSTPFQILLVKQLLNSNINLNLVNISKKIEDIEKIKSSKINLWEIIKIANIRYVSSIAEKIFSSYDNLESAYTDIESGQVAYLSDKLGINNNDSTVLAIKVYKQLLEFKEELLFAETQFNVIKYSTNPIRISISGNIPGYMNKSEFIKMLNTRYYEYTTFVLDSTISKNTNILVTDFDKSTKYRTAVRINEEYISKSIANGTMELSEVDDFKNVDDLTKKGEVIAICNESELLKRLDKHFHTNISRGK